MIPKNQQKTELLVGVFVLFGLMLLGGLVLKFGDFQYLFRKKYELSLVFRDAGKLTKDTPVRRGGVEIGRVTANPTLVDGINGVRVPLTIYQDFLIAKGSSFALKTSGIIGDMYIEVTPPLFPVKETIEPGSQLRGDFSADIADSAGRVADKSLVVLEDIRGSLADLKSAIGKISTGVLGDENLTNLRDALKGLNTTLTKIDSEVLSAENTTALKDTLTSLHASSTKLGVNLDALGVTVTTANDMLKQKLSPSLDEIAKAAATIRLAANGFSDVTKDMHSGPGLMTALLRDQKLRDDFASLINNLRRHGLVWGYKDDAAKLKSENPTPAPRKGLFNR
jgi:phospholipid/cholesterol/gamma-HCH transport system substrate-binding protein